MRKRDMEKIKRTLEYTKLKGRNRVLLGKVRSKHEIIKALHETNTRQLDYIIEKNKNYTELLKKHMETSKKYYSTAIIAIVALLYILIR